MLRFTHSFYRYGRIPFDLNPHTHVRLYTHLCKINKCSVPNTQYAINPLLGSGQQQWLLGNTQRKSRQRQLYNSAMSMTNEGNPILVTPNTLAYVRLDSLADDSSPNWQADYEEAMSADGASTSSANSGARPKKKQKTDTSELRNVRYWEKLAEPTVNDNSCTFKVVSYNLLAQCLLETHADLYVDCDPRDLKWPVRAAKLYKEILELDPDILCLQEVQAQHMRNFYSKLERHGYFGVFKQKTGYRRDGCAIYFKKDRFELADHMTVQLFQPNMRVLNRDNVGLMLKLVPKNRPHSPIVVVTTHLLYNPNRPDVRLAQMQLLLAEIDRFAYNYNAVRPGHLPVIFTGDFNSTPTSAVMELLNFGSVDATTYRKWSDWRELAVTDSCQHLSVYLNRLKGLPTELGDLRMFNSDFDLTDEVTSFEDTPAAHGELFNSPFLTHTLRLASVYSLVKVDKSHEATTYQGEWVTVDYMYYSSRSQLKLLERLRLPTVEECASFGRMPNGTFPSDHLPLGAVFELTANQEDM